MDDSNLHFKQQTYLNTCSDADDSTSFPSFPWFPENNRRRKSRLGTHRNQIRRVFQETTSNDSYDSSSNKENIHNQFTSKSSPPNAAPAETDTQALKCLTFNDDLETSRFSFTQSKFNDQTSPVLSLTRVLDDGLSPLVTSFEKSKTVASSFPSFLAEDEIDGILREINSPDNVESPRFPLSPNSTRTRTSVLQSETSFDASVSSVIANQFQTAERKLNKSFSDELPNDASPISAVEDRRLAPKERTNNCEPFAVFVDSNCRNSFEQQAAVEDLPWAPKEQTNNFEPVAVYVDSNCRNSFDQQAVVEDLRLAPKEMNNFEPVAVYVDANCMTSFDQRNSSIDSCKSANSMELSTNSVFQPETKSSGSLFMHPNSAIPNLDSKNLIKSSPSLLSEPTTENCGLNCSKSIELESNSLQSKNQFSEPARPAQLPTNLSSMQDQENVVNFQNPCETNSIIPINPSPMRDQENYPDFKNNNSLKLIHLSSIQGNYNYVNSLPNEMNPELPIDLSSIPDPSAANFRNRAELSSNLQSAEIKHNNEMDVVLSSSELTTKSMSINSVVEIPSSVKSQKASLSVSDVDKISSPPVIIDSSLEQKKHSAGELAAPPKTTAVMKPFEAPKSTVQFAEPAVTREFAVPRNSNKIPAVLTVKGKPYKVLNILGSGGSSVVFQVSDPETNELLALKKVELPDEDDEIAEGYLNEVQMLENLQNCDVIIRIFDHQLVHKNGRKTLYVVMEKGDTDLSSLIKSVNESKKLSIPMIIYYWTEMLAAVNEVHRRGIIHSDLKPANFVLVRGRLKLIDFGIASSIQGDMTSVLKDNFCGTLNYMSPEATSYVEAPSGGIGYKITFKTDVWSLGCILYNLVYGRLPFHHIRKRMEKIHAIISPTMNVEFPEKKDVPPILIALLKSCLEKDYKQRPTVQELLDRTMRIFQCSSVAN